MVFDFLKDLFATKPHTYGSKIKNVPPIEDYIGLGVLIDVRGSSNENNNLEIKDKIKEFIAFRIDEEFVDKLCNREKITYSFLRGVVRAVDDLYFELRFPLGKVNDIMFKAIDEITSLKDPEDKDDYIISKSQFSVNVVEGGLFAMRDGICETIHNEAYNKYFEYEIMNGDIERVKRYREFMPVRDRAQLFISKKIWDRFENLDIEGPYKIGLMHALCNNIWANHLSVHSEFISYEYFLYINFKNKEWSINVLKELDKLKNVKEYNDGLIDGNELKYDIYDMPF